MKALILFRSTRDAIRAERACLDTGLVVRVVPVPRQISSECGIALEIDRKLAATVKALLAEGNHGGAADQLSDSQIDELAEFVLSLSDVPEDAKTPEE